MNSIMGFQVLLLIWLALTLIAAISGSIVHMTSGRTGHLWGISYPSTACPCLGPLSP